MKHRAFLISCSLGVAALAMLPLAFLLNGCVTTRPGSQTAEVRAEQVLAVSLAAMDSFLAFEKRNSAAVGPLVRDIAYRVRLEAPKALDTANNLRRAYKLNRSSANEAGLLTALSVVDSLVSEIRVWVPLSSAAETITSKPSSVESVTPSLGILTREAEASKTVTAQSWAVLVPLFVDLAREIYSAVNKAREAAAQSAEWTLAQEQEFSARLAALKTSTHWSL